MNKADSSSRNSAPDSDAPIGTPRRRRLRPKWTIATMLFILAWSAPAVWLNIRLRYPQVAFEQFEPFVPETTYYGGYGFPWLYALGFNNATPQTIQPQYTSIQSYWALIGDVLVALVAVAVLTWLSNQLLRALSHLFFRRRSG